MLQKGFDILKDLTPSLMGQGAYTSGNTQSIQLLSQGAVTMIPAWSDQALSAIKQGVLPDTTGLVQLSDLGFPGGFTWNTIPTNGANKAAGAQAAGFHPQSEEIQSAVDHRARRLPGRVVGQRLQGAARQVRGGRFRPRSRYSRAVRGTRRSTTAGTATSRRTWTALSDVLLRQATSSAHRKISQWAYRPPARCHPGAARLLDDHLPDHLGDGDDRLLADGADGTPWAFTVNTYKFFFTDAYSLANLCLTLWTTFLCAIILIIVCLPIALYLRFAKEAARRLCAGPGDLPTVRALDYLELTPSSACLGRTAWSTSCSMPRTCRRSARHI